MKKPSELEKVMNMPVGTLLFDSTVAKIKKELPLRMKDMEERIFQAAQFTGTPEKKARECIKKIKRAMVREAITRC